MKKDNKFNAIAAIAAIALIAVSCGKEPVVSIDRTDSNSSEFIYATAENSTTKTALSGNDTDGYEVVWSSGDEITIGGYGGNLYQLYSGAGTTSAIFALISGGTLADGQYDSYYRMFSNSLPATQKYEEGSIKGSPMHATVTVTGGVPGPANFKNLCGLLRLTIKKRQDISLKSISISADQAMCGSFNIVDDAAVITSSSKQVTLTCDKAVPLTYDGKDFYIALPPNDYSNVVITLTDENGSVCTKKLNTAKTLNIERSKITSAQFYVERLEFIPGNLVAVDLGLPSGNKWANMNMGAYEADGDGDYFAWGETSFKNSYDQYGYFDYGIGKYSLTGKTILDPDDDVAHVRWGGNWQMPTLEDFKELFNSEYTTWTWYESNPVTDSQGDKCYHGFLIESKTTGKSIFLKACGEYSEYDGLINTDNGYYWTNTLSDDNRNTAKILEFRYYLLYDHYVADVSLNGRTGWRHYGLSVRPVWKN